MTSKHTPGPWRWAEGYEGLFSVHDGNSPILDYVPYEGMWIAEWREEAEANARLIAMAPRMYEVLKGVMEKGRFNMIQDIEDILNQLETDQ